MVKILRRIGLVCVLLSGLLFTVPESGNLNAQCPMCRMTAESNLKAGGTAGRGLNRGILYMLAMPYLLVGTLGYIWWRNNGVHMQNESPE